MIWGYWMSLHGTSKPSGARRSQCWLCGLVFFCMKPFTLQNFETSWSWVFFSFFFWAVFFIPDFLTSCCQLRWFRGESASLWAPAMAAAHAIQLDQAVTYHGFRLQIWGWKYTLPETNSSHLKIGWAVFQPSIFRCHVSFREGTQQKWYVRMMETWRLQLGDKSIYRCSFRIVKNTWVPSSRSCIPTSLGYL